jgi:ABC-type dipeptide/oligopeptide/nickel transport system ATPase component
VRSTCIAVRGQRLDNVSHHELFMLAGRSQSGKSLHTSSYLDFAPAAMAAGVFAGFLARHLTALM